MAVLHNRKNTSVTIHDAANATYTIAGNTSSSNVATLDEVLTGASIKNVYYGSAGGAWNVKRGANLVLTLNGTGFLDFAASGNLLKKDSTGTLVLELVGTANGFIQMELQKEGTLPTTY
jgi:hypothetical protein